MDEMVVLCSTPISGDELYDSIGVEALCEPFNGVYKDIKERLEQLSKRYPKETFVLCVRGAQFFDVWEDTIQDGGVIEVRSFWEQHP